MWKRKQKLIYVAGPYRDSRGEYYVKENIRAAEAAAIALWWFGAAVICPHMNTSLLGGAYGMTDKTWLEGDLTMVERCDAVYVLKNWEASSGTRGEIEFAKSCNIPVFFEIDLLMDTRPIKNFIEGVG